MGGRGAQEDHSQWSTAYERPEITFVLPVIVTARKTICDSRDCILEPGQHHHQKSSQSLSGRVV